MAEKVLAMLRDASAFDRPNTRSPKKYHMESSERIAACTGDPLDETFSLLAAEVPAHQRCQRPGCRVRWPN